MKFTLFRQEVKLAGQKVQAGAGAGVGGIMEDRTSSQSSAVEPGNIVISPTQPLAVLQLPAFLLHHSLCSFASPTIEL